MAEPDGGRVVLERRGPCLLATLDHAGRANALSRTVVGELDTAMTVAEAEARPLVLTGAGENFCSGADVVEMQDGDRDELMARTWAALDRLQRLTVPVVAAVNGPAIAGGVELLLSSDLRVASTTARIRPRGAPWGAVTATRLARFLPLGIVTEAIWCERVLTPADLAQWGFYNRLVEPDEVVAAALELADRLAAIPRHVVTTGRLLLREPPRSSSAVLETQARGSRIGDPARHLRS